MDTLLSMRVFCQVVELRSFSLAAARLGMSGAMATKHVKHLESYLDARLLNRSSRHLSLTEPGERYFERFSEIGGMLDDARATIGDTASVPSGVLRISVPAWFSCRRFSQLLARYREQYPDVTFDVDLTGRMVNLVDEGFDLALRNVPGPASSLITRLIGMVPFQVVAAPAYLLRTGTPKKLDDLNQLGLVACSKQPEPAIVTLLGPEGHTESTLKVVMRANTELLIRDAVLDGAGVAILPSWLVEEDVAAGRLTALLPEYASPKSPIYAAYPSRRHLSPKVRSFIDFLTVQGDEFCD